MRLTTKKIRLIEMTKEEMTKFLQAVQKASEGQTVHYAEEKLDDGTFLGVSVVKEHEQKVEPPRSHKTDSRFQNKNEESRRYL